GHPAKQFVRVNLRTGSTQSLTEAPISISGGMWADVFGGLDWSRDGKSILLPGTYLKSNEDAPSRPCIAVLDVPSSVGTCVEVLKGSTGVGGEEGFHGIQNIKFIEGNKDRVLVTFLNHAEAIAGSTEYRRGVDGTWQVAAQNNGPLEDWHNGLRV